jgi:hypothetical protein
MLPRFFHNLKVVELGIEAIVAEMLRVGDGEDWGNV